VFHWSLLCSVAGAVASAQLGGNWMEWHPRFGATVLGLLAFRIVWGVAGPRYARFRSFLYAPRAIVAHFKSIRSSADRHAGHSPSGGLSVFALLGVLLSLAVSGLFSSDSISTDGALTRFVGEDAVSLATAIHVTLQWVIYGLVVLHVAAVTAYLVIKKDDLIRPMIHGDKTGIRAPEAADSLGVRLGGLALMMVLVTLSLGVFSA
jgi:cytochrome b